MEQQACFPIRRRVRVRLALQLLLAGLAVNAAVALADVQRMLIESQSFSIPAGGKAEPRAMCLDASQSSPSPATQFTVAPKGELGDIRVTTADGRQMPLQEAIDKHIVEVRGTRGYAAVEFRNLLSSGEIKVDVLHNSVVIPDASYRTADLQGLPELHATRLMSQSALWASRSAQIGQSSAGSAGGVVVTAAAAPAVHAVRARPAPGQQAPAGEAAAPAAPASPAPVPPQN
jgi:hypothetical protein